MSIDFSLIKEIEKKSSIKNSPHAGKDYGIKYQEYEMRVDGKDVMINIPLRETENFEQFIEELNTTSVTRSSLKKILRHFRGMRGE
jgi:hypothetical protein